MTRADFIAATKRTHVREVRADVVDRAGAAVSTEPLPLVSGELIEDMSHARGVRSGSLRLPLRDDLLPKTPGHMLSPFSGNYVSVSVTIAGDTVQMGRLLISAVEVQRPGDIAVTLTDAALPVSTDLLEWEYTTPAAYTATDLINRMIRTAVGSNPTWGTNDLGTQKVKDYYDPIWSGGTSQWAVCLDIADHFNCDLYYDETLTLHARDREADRPVADTLGTGSDGVIINMASGQSRVGLINRATITLEGEDDTSKRGSATITTGPLRYGGPLGNMHYVATERVEGRATQGAVDKLARKALQERQGFARRIDLACSPVPHIRAGDMVGIRYPGGDVEHGVVRRISHGLATDARTTLTTEYYPEMDAAPVPLLEGEASVR